MGEVPIFTNPCYRPLGCTGGEGITHDVAHSSGGGVVDCRVFMFMSGTLQKRFSNPCDLEFFCF